MVRTWRGVVAAWGLLTAACGGPAEPEAAMLGALEVRPARVDFGEVQFESHVQEVVTVHNPDARPWVVEVALDGGEGLSIRPGAYDVEPGTTLEIPVALYAAWEPETQAGTLALSLREADGRLDVPLTGQSVAPRLSVSPLVVDFGDVPVGETRRLGVTVSNRGVDDVDLGETKTWDGETYMTSTAFRMDYPARPSWGGAWAVPQGRAVNLEAVFTPEAEGDWSGEHRLDVRPSYPGSPRIVLRGRGVR